jgi:hypothetical protein
MQNKLSLVVCTVAALAGAPDIAQAAVVAGGRLTVIDANTDVTLTYLDGGGAGYTNQLLLVMPSNPNVIFNNHVAVPGTSQFNLGQFAAGTELVFKIASDNGTETIDYFTGAGTGNPDGAIHALVDDAFVDPFNAGALRVKVAFEDLPNPNVGNPGDFTDMVFSLNNVAVTAVPLPGSLALLGMALGGIAGFGARRSATHRD